jgi:hypothetical protein
VALGFLRVHLGLYRDRITDVEGLTPAETPRG